MWEDTASYTYFEKYNRSAHRCSALHHNDCQAADNTLTSKEECRKGIQETLLRT